MLRVVYTALVHVLAPLALGALALRSASDPSYRDRWRERYGYTALRFATRPIWIHAVSVGEVQAAVPLVRELLRRHPQVPIVMTTATPTGAARVKAAFAASVAHAYLPYDLPGATARFLERIAPRVAIVMETEIWPNLFRACAKRHIPLMLASARLSAKSVRRYASFASLTRAALEHVTIAAQTSADAERYLSIGARAQQLHVTGNVKFDIAVGAEVASTGERLRAMLGRERPVWVAGSTHSGEEPLVLDAHRRVRQRHANALLVLAPRHPQRFGEVAELLRSRGESSVARSTQGAVQADHSVLLLDTLGELLAFYAAADVAFVAGSLVPIGGHNLLEPAALGKAIVVGPYNFNAPDIANLFLASEAASQADSPDDLAVVVNDLLADEAKRTRCGERARQLVDANRGAVQKVAAMIDAALAATDAPS